MHRGRGASWIRKNNKSNNDILIETSRKWIQSWPRNLTWMLPRDFQNCTFSTALTHYQWPWPVWIPPWPVPWAVILPEGPAITTVPALGPDTAALPECGPARTAPWDAGPARIAPWDAGPARTAPWEAGPATTTPCPPWPAYPPYPAYPEYPGYPE